jgi:Na+/melibiose symporter-like transporter
MDQPASGRFWMLPTLFVCVFGIVAMALTKMVPSPLRELDYMIIGSVSVLAGLLAVFVLVNRTMERPVLPPADEVKPKPRRRHSTSILDLNGGPDNSDPQS